MARVLVIEDDDTLLTAYCFAFEAAGYVVDRASRGEDGMQLTIANHPDIILLDMLLFNESGLGFLRQLRQTPEVNETKVILFTNLEYDDSITAAQDIGIAGYLVKSQTSPKEAVAIVDHLLSDETKPL